jgi:hypothetical protein
VQHPLETIFSGTGDCEDQAGAARYLLSLLSPPIKTVVTNTTENHYQCIYVEKSTSDRGEAQYNYCRIEGVGGFYRSSNKFSTPGAAIESSFQSSRYENSAEMDLATKDRRINEAPNEQARQNLREFYAKLGEVARSGGITTLGPPTFETSMLTNINGAHSNCAGRVNAVKFSDTAYWERYTRFAEQSPRAKRMVALVNEAKSGPPNTWRTLNRGQEGYQYYIDNNDNLFASKTPSDKSKGYYLLNAGNNYQWEHKEYT